MILDKNVKISEYSQYVRLLESRIKSLVEENSKLRKQKDAKQLIYLGGYKRRIIY